MWVGQWREGSLICYTNAQIKMTKITQLVQSTNIVTLYCNRVLVGVRGSREKALAHKTNNLLLTDKQIQLPRGKKMEVLLPIAVKLPQYGHYNNYSAALSAQKKLETNPKCKLFYNKASHPSFTQALQLHPSTVPPFHHITLCTFLKGSIIFSTQSQGNKLAQGDQFALASSRANLFFKFPLQTPPLWGCSDFYKSYLLLSRLLLTFETAEQKKKSQLY